MSSKFSVKSEKPEKCAIEQKNIKKGGTGGGDSAVQQSQVSSSKPTIVTEDILGPLLLEALDGFRFVLNLHGKVEFVSENVTHFLKYVQDDLIGKSVYNIIHTGDHTQFSNRFLSVGGRISWSTDSLGGKGPVFNCRFLVKPLCRDVLEANQTYVHQYESMQILSIHHSQNTCNNENTENSGSSFVCIACRLPLAEKTNTMLGSEQFTTKQDLQGKIIGCDISGITQAGFNCPVLVGQKIQDFCFANDIQDLSKHFQEVVRNGSNTSGLHRFKMLDKRFVYVRTISKLFQSPVTGLPEFIMSNHSIVRDCDNDKGTASSSLMNAIIGPSLQKKQAKAMPCSGSMPMTSKSIIGSSVTTNLNSSKLLGISDNNLNEDFLNQILTLNLPNSSGSSAFQGSQFMSTSNSSILNPQLSISQVYQQFQQNLSNSSDNVNQQQASHANVIKQLQWSLSSVSGNGNQNNNNNMEQISKKHPVALANLGKRSSSLELPQVQNQAQLQQQSREQKSSLSAQSQSSMRNVAFSNPMQQVNTFGYQRRSPAVSPVPNLQGNFSTPFPPHSPSPSGLSQSVWNQQSAISQGKLGHHQSDNQSAATSLSHYHHLQQQNSFESILRQQNSFESTLRDKKVKCSGKCAQHSSLSGTCRSEPGTPNGTRSRHNSHQGMMEMSPVDNIQSPQPGPGQSPLEKSQSTSTNVGDPHHLLKTLLSQEDDAGMRNLCSVKCEQTAEAQSDQKKHMDMEKNEAEAKATHNILLKHLLSTDFNSMFQETITTDSSSKMTASLTVNDGHSSFIRKLLEGQMDTCRSVPAESTSANSGLDQLRRRHQSEPQKPQSATSRLSSLLTSPMTPNTSGQSTVDMSLLKEFLKAKLHSSLNVTNTNMPMNTTFSSDSQTVNRISVSGMGVNKSKNVDKLLNLLWEDNSQDGNLTMKERIQNLKRKADLLDMESSDRQESAVHGINSSDSSRLLNENALLMQLLSKKGNNDIVVNTLSTIQPSGVPQSRIPPGISNKLLKVKPSTSLTSNEPKRARFETGNTKLATHEHALSTPLKLELTSSSNQSFNSLLDIGCNLNSGISIISDKSGSSQLKKQFSDLQQILSNSAGDSRNNSSAAIEVNMNENTASASNSQNNSSVAIEVNVADNADPLLAQILQQAQELQHDITVGTFLNVNQSCGLNLQPNSGMNNYHLFDSSSSVISASVGVNNVNSALNQNNLPSSDLLQQLELALSNPNLNLNEIDNLFGNSSISFEEQTAIDAIQEQLMMEMTGLSAASSAQNTSLSSSLISGETQHRLTQNTVAVCSQSPSYQMPSNMLESQENGMHTSTNAQFEQGLLRVDGSDISGLARSMPQLPSYSQAQGVQIPGQGPRLLHHQGALPSANQPQRPVFNNSNPNSTTMQGRQPIIQQQKSQHMQEQDNQRLQQKQNCQKLLLQQHQQQQQQFSPQYTQQFPCDGVSMGTSGSLLTMAFPESLADLMNSGTIPNVTLEHNHIPGPMSPCYQGLQQAAPTSSMGQMIVPNHQLSPNFTQQVSGQQGQWNVHLSQGNLGISLSSSIQYNNCLRSMSAGTLQASTPQQFSILSSAPYQGSQKIYPLQHQQQQLYQQDHASQIQRQISMSARASPRTSLSPFGPESSSDPLIISPGTGRTQAQQMSPSYNHGASGSSYGQGSIPSASNVMPLPQYSQVQGHMGMTSSNIDMDLNLFDNHKKPVDMPLSNNASVSSQTIKRELRNICNARSQAGILQSQMVPQQPVQQHVSQQHPQCHEVKEQGSELPDDILEQITEMNEEHRILEDNIIRSKQEEVRNVYEKFWQLASSDGSESKSISLFRNQLSQESIEGVMSASEEPFLTDLQAVQIINQLRKPVEAINVADQRTGLLQKLLL